ncbi:hypothetical protein C7B62_16625 [Pleurocapsa sp. CCALA 161]|uniref:hypothetical protein n=1 Tax=Pleurocapsa sp. CCALA 161 TaxID=2107688 RepID=UPI000D06E473|nr:hypothetical protein [Pleurocapsa sp. CCALA 161]PSB08467.1 hypothetical protein C7B62_16625 [Pleurocapsa sp. CCALA 161]
MSEYLKPGCYLKVTGMRKNKLHQAKVEYKAYRIELLSEQVVPSKATTVASKATVLEKIYSM